MLVQLKFFIFTLVSKFFLILIFIMGKHGNWIYKTNINPITKLKKNKIKLETYSRIGGQVCIPLASFEVSTSIPSKWAHTASLRKFCSNKGEMKKMLRICKKGKKAKGLQREKQIILKTWSKDPNKHKEIEDIKD